MYAIRWEPRARRQLRKIGDRREQAMVIAAVERLQAFPMVPGVRRLVRHRFGYRLRSNRYRVFFDVRDETKTIEIQEIRKRDESTY